MKELFCRGMFLFLIHAVLPYHILSAQDNSLTFDQFSQVFTNLANEKTPSIVKIAALKQKNSSEDFRKLVYGSGWLVSSEGYIVTCGHVVADSKRISVYFKGQEIEASLIELDPEVDIAILKIEGTNLPHLLLGDSDLTDIGEWVVSIGYPFSLSPFVARGIVGSKDELGLFLDILTSPGNSGGPLLNLQGKVIGISSSLFQFEKDFKGAAIAIPVNKIKDLLLRTL